MSGVKVMFLGLSPGNPELKHKPYTPNRDAPLKDMIEYIQKPILKGYDTNYRNTMKERIGSELEYVKTNVVHGALDKKSAQKCLEACGNKFLLPMIRLFCGLKYVIVYDFEDQNVLNYVNKKLDIDIDFKNSTAAIDLARSGFPMSSYIPHPIVPSLKRLSLRFLQLRS